MTREDIYSECLSKVDTSKFLLLELPTGYGKSKCSLDLVNHLAETKYKGKPVSMLLLVAKRVHKKTWADEINKWGGIHVSSLVVECYESLHKHEHQHFDIIVLDEVHHAGSPLRLDALKTISFGNAIGLSATIPQKLKDYFLYEYHASIVSCNITEAIDSSVLPEPQIVLFPLQLDSFKNTEVIEVNPKAKNIVRHGFFCDLWKYRKLKVHALVSCTARQKVNDYNSTILHLKQTYTRTRQEYIRKRWLFECGERLKYLANLKNPVVLSLLQRLSDERTITFCKTIEQAELLGKHCIHSKNKDSDLIYRDFNDRKIDHITSVNILNENANLVDCRYAVFANYSSSELVGVQRTGRALRHKSPVIIMPYYENTREQEILEDMLKDFSPDCIRTIHSVEEL